MQYGHVNGACLNEMNVALWVVVRLLRPFCHLSLKVKETRTDPAPPSRITITHTANQTVQDALSAVWKNAVPGTKQDNGGQRILWRSGHQDNGGQNLKGSSAFERRPSSHPESSRGTEQGYFDAVNGFLNSNI